MAAQAQLPAPIFNFGAQNEHPAAELALLDVLQRRKKGGGCCDAVDVNKNQLLLSELTIAAGRTLSGAEFEVFLGTTGNAAQRQALYDRVRPKLKPATATFWDEHRDTIAAGVIQCGGAERIYNILSKLLPSLEISDIVAKPDVLSQCVYDAWGYENLKRCMVGLPEPLLQGFNKKIAPMLSKQVLTKLAAVQRGEASVDYLMHLLLRGGLPSKTHAQQNHYGAAPPPFFDDELLERARKREAEVAVGYHEGPIQAIAPKGNNGQGYDLIDISNILDMLPDPALHKQVLTPLVSSLKPGGALLVRWSATDDGYLHKLLPEVGLTVDPELTAAVRKAETSFIATDIAVGVRPKQAACC